MQANKLPEEWGDIYNFEMTEVCVARAGWRFDEVELRDEIEESSYQGFGYGWAWIGVDWRVFFPINSCQQVMYCHG